MSFCAVQSKRIALALGLVATWAALAPNGHAQTPPAQSAEDQQFEKLLTGAELFFKKSFNEQVQRWEYQVAWSQGGDTSLITMYLRELGKKGDGSRICIAYGWTQVLGMPQGQEVPPAVIKAMAAINGNLYTGNISAEGAGVFANTGIVLTDLTSNALWVYLWDLHDTRTQLKKEFEKLVAGG
jgi:hypothetical protein